MTSSLSQRDLLLLPQTGTAGPTRVTSTHMPSALCEKLIQLCNQYHVIISDNGNSMDCRMKRRNLWIEISKQLNNEFNVDFTADQYKKKYQNLKTALKTKMQNINSTTRNVSPENNRRDAPPPMMADVKPELTVTIQPDTSPVRPTPQVPTTPLSSLFDSKSSLLALAVHAAQQQVMHVGLANAAAAAAAAGVSPHMGGELPMGSEQHLDMQTLLNGMSCQERPPSVDITGPSVSHHLQLMRPISTGGYLERAMDRSVEDASALGTTENGSAVGSASVSDHAAPLSSLPHISPQQDEDPARMFCLSLADPLRQIRDTNPTLYIQLKKQISTMVLDAELDTIKAEEEENRMD